MKHVTILGVRVDCVDFAQTLMVLARWIGEDLPAATDSSVLEQSALEQSTFGQFALRQPSPVSSHPTSTRQLCTVNPEFIMHARHTPTFAAVLQDADLCVPDGIGVLWAARHQGVHLPERVTGSDGIYHICERAANQGWSVFLLGAAPGVAITAALRLQSLYPGLLVAGTHSGSPSDSDWPTIQAQLQATQPDILFVAFGHPNQDLWIDQHRHELRAKVALGIGGAFDFVAGVTTRAPRWMQRLGLEWLYRLITQPWRWRRMLVLPWFAGLVLWQQWRYEADNGQIANKRTNEEE